MVDDMKLLLGLSSTDKDDLLDLLLGQAKSELKRLSNRDDVSEYKGLIIKMAIFNYNRLGTEGLKSESYSGVSYTYEEDYPESILKEIRSISKLRILW